jgi:lipid A 3-O-deacylase
MNTPRGTRVARLRIFPSALLVAGSLGGASTAALASTSLDSINLALLSPAQAAIQPNAATTTTNTPGTNTPAAAPGPAASGDRFALAPIDGDHAWFMTTGFGLARDNDPGTHGLLFATMSTFLDQGFEFQLELNGYSFSQPGDDALGAGFHFNLRWHVWHGTYGETRDNAGPLSSTTLTTAPDWTIFFDGGIGMIFSTDDVPENGTSLNFSPRAGVGFTARLGESSTRLVAGVRWHHMSNARINGDDENPDFNAPLGYLGLQWGF